MSHSRRKFLTVVGGGVILAASAGFALVATRKPQSATLAWQTAGRDADPRRKALSYALLAPNPHNRQPWLVDPAEPGTITLYADPTRLLPHTDPQNRQITIGLGCFLEVMRMAASNDGYRVSITPFPEGEAAAGLDERPVARAVFTADATTAPDPLFAQVPVRRTNKEPYDTTKPVPETVLPSLRAAAVAGTQFGASFAEVDIADLRTLTRHALTVEIETPRTYKESVDLFRIGSAEVDANPDGIDFTGPLFETMAATGLFTRETALDTTSQAYKAGLAAVYENADTAMGHIWLVTADNRRIDQIAAGADWVRVNLAATKAGLALQPLSQALQEYPEMAAHYTAIHARLAPDGGTVQMLARIGYGAKTSASPRWPLETRIINA